MEASLVSDPSLAQFFGVLADSRRRHVLSLTGARPGRTDVDELARSIAALERGEGSTESPSESVRSVAVSLHHVHLPKLSAARIVEYDADAGTVSRIPLPGAFESILATVVGNGRGVKPE